MIVTKMHNFSEHGHMCRSISAKIATVAYRDSIEMSEINTELSKKLALLPHVAAREKFNNPLFTLPFHEGLLYCEGWAVMDFGDGLGSAHFIPIHTKKLMIIHQHYNY